MRLSSALIVVILLHLVAVGALRLQQHQGASKFRRRRIAFACPAACAAATGGCGLQTGTCARLKYDCKQNAGSSKTADTND